MARLAGPIPIDGLATEPMLICGIREGLTKGAILPKSIWLDVPQKTIGLVKDGFGFTPEAISFCELYSRIRQGVLDSTGSGE